MARPSPLSRPGPRMASGLGPQKSSDVITYGGHVGTDVAAALDGRPPTHVLASTDPTATDDDGDGHVVGCRWINLAGAEEFVAVDVSTGAAVWESTTAGGGGSISVTDGTTTVNPTTTLEFDPAAFDVTDQGGGGALVEFIGGFGGSELVQDEFVGDGIEDTFTLSDTPNAGLAIVTINGAQALPDTYTITGTSLVFDTPPDDEAEIVVTYATTILGGALALDDLTDVDAPSPADGDVLTWDAGGSEWVPAAPTGGSGSLSPGIAEMLSTPSIVNAEDDHFEGSSLDSKWLAYTGFNATPGFGDIDSWVELTGTGGAKLQAFPGGDWTIETQFMHGDHLTSGYSSVGLILASGTTATSATHWCYGYGFDNSLVTGRVVIDQFVNNAYNSTPNSFQLVGDGADIHRPRHLRIIKVGTNYTFHFSSTRWNWTVIRASGGIGFTPTHFGIYSSLQASTINGSYFNYFVRT